MMIKKGIIYTFILSVFITPMVFVSCKGDMINDCKDSHSNNTSSNYPLDLPHLFSISGRVIKKENGVEGTVVNIIGNEIDQTVLTDTEGNYRFNNITNGNYRLSVVKSGTIFMPNYVDVIVDNSNRNIENIKAINPYWSSTYGGFYNEKGGYIIQTSDGGYIVAGSSTSFGSGQNDIYIVKLYVDGSVSWDKTYGGILNEKANCINQTSDGGYIIAGYTTSYGSGEKDIWILKLDEDGSIDTTESWQRTIGSNKNEEAFSIIQTSDGGYIAVGYIESPSRGKDLWIGKINTDGTLLWQKTYGGSSDEEAFSIKETSSGYIIVGYTDSYGSGKRDLWLLKTDFLGNTDTSNSWQRTFGGIEDDAGLSVEITSDGYYLVSGYTRSYGNGGKDVWVLKIDSDGNIGATSTWEKTFGGASDEIGNLIKNTSDGGSIVSCTVGSSINDKNYRIIKLDTGGSQLWQKTYGGPTSNDIVVSIIPTLHGGYIIAGYTNHSVRQNYNLWILSVDEFGDIP